MLRRLLISLTACLASSYFSSSYWSSSTAGPVDCVCETKKKCLRIDLLGVIGTAIGMVLSRVMSCGIIAERCWPDHVILYGDVTVMIKMKDESAFNDCVISFGNDLSKPIWKVIASSVNISQDLNEFLEASKSQLSPCGLTFIDWTDQFITSGKQAFVDFHWPKVQVSDRAKFQSCNWRNALKPWEYAIIPAINKTLHDTFIDANHTMTILGKCGFLLGPEWSLSNVILNNKLPSLADASAHAKLVECDWNAALLPWGNPKVPGFNKTMAELSVVLKETRKRMTSCGVELDDKTIMDLIMTRKLPAVSVSDRAMFLTCDWAHALELVGDPSMLGMHVQTAVTFLKHAQQCGVEFLGNSKSIKWDRVLGCVLKSSGVGLAICESTTSITDALHPVANLLQPLLDISNWLRFSSLDLHNVEAAMRRSACLAYNPDRVMVFDYLSGHTSLPLVLHALLSLDGVDTELVHVGSVDEATQLQDELLDMIYSKMDGESTFNITKLAGLVNAGSDTPVEVLKQLVAQLPPWRAATEVKGAINAHGVVAVGSRDDEYSLLVGKDSGKLGKIRSYPNVLVIKVADPDALEDSEDSFRLELQKEDSTGTLYVYRLKAVIQNDKSSSWVHAYDRPSLKWFTYRGLTAREIGESQVIDKDSSILFYQLLASQTVNGEL